MLIDCSICALFLFTEIESDGKNIEKGKYEHNVRLWISHIEGKRLYLRSIIERLI